jgi:hypothetical protein
MGQHPMRYPTPPSTVQAGAWWYGTSLLLFSCASEHRSRVPSFISLRVRFMRVRVIRARAREGAEAMSMAYS